MVRHNRLSKICCPKCGYNLRRLEKNFARRKNALYECPYCHEKWLVTMGNGTPTLSYSFTEVKEEEIIDA